LAPVPGQQLINAAVRVGSDAADQVGETGLRIDVVKLAGLERRIEDCGALTAGGGAKEGYRRKSRR